VSAHQVAGAGGITGSDRMQQFAVLRVGRVEIAERAKGVLSVRPGERACAQDLLPQVRIPRTPVT